MFDHMQRAQMCVQGSRIAPLFNDGEDGFAYWRLVCDIGSDLYGALILDAPRFRSYQWRELRKRCRKSIKRVRVQFNFSKYVYHWKILLKSESTVTDGAANDQPTPSMWFRCVRDRVCYH